MSRDSDIAVLGRAMKEHRRLRRERYGVDCPRCKEVRPRADPSKLMPRQRCKVDGYRDPRPHLSDEQEDALWKELGFETMRQERSK